MLSAKNRTFHGFHRLMLLVIVCLICVIGGSSIYAQESQLGKVEFPTSGSEKAQAHFIRGLAALHSFWYEEALEAFRESTKVEPDFAMGYWGEAMAHNHPLWSEQDITAAREVLAKIKETPKLTERERAYLAAVRLLYGEGDKKARDAAYSAAMEKIYRAYPDDLDAACFYSLSLLGIGGEKGYRLQAKAGAIALEVYQKNPNHPGAAHYIIHAFDDPDHAILALPAARRYASIAPEAHHARHMPSHIFLQLGMWPEAAASNESAWESSDAWMKRKKLSLSVRDYHSLHWLLYCYLQQGRYNQAEQLLALMKKVMSESTYDNKLRPQYYENNYANMAAAFIVETERWNLASQLFPESKAAPATAEQTTMGGSHGGHTPAATSSTSAGATMRTSQASVTLPIFIRGLAAAAPSVWRTRSSASPCGARRSASGCCSCPWSTCRPAAGRRGRARRSASRRRSSGSCPTSARWRSSPTCPCCGATTGGRSTTSWPAPSSSCGRRPICPTRTDRTAA